MTLDAIIPESQYFRIAGGPSVPTIVALRAHLRTMPREQFEHHANIKRNDFADWVRHVFHEDALATKMQACLSKDEMLFVLDEALRSRARPVPRAPPVAVVAEARPPPAQAVPPPDAVRSLSADLHDVVRNKPAVPNVEMHIPEKSAPGGAGVDGADHVGDWNDEKFGAIRREMSERNEKLGDKYDTITKRFQTALEDPVPKELEDLSEKMLSRHNDILQRISEERRAGHDMFFPAAMIKQFPSKLTLAKATRSRSDFAIASLVLDQVERMIGEEIASEGMSVKQQVLAMAGVNEDGKPVGNAPDGAAGKSAAKGAGR